jgi:hypothetical protein
MPEIARQQRCRPRGATRSRLYADRRARLDDVSDDELIAGFRARLAAKSSSPGAWSSSALAHRSTLPVVPPARWGSSLRRRSSPLDPAWPRSPTPWSARCIFPSRRRVQGTGAEAHGWGEIRHLLGAGGPEQRLGAPQVSLAALQIHHGGRRRSCEWGPDPIFAVSWPRGTAPRRRGRSRRE